MKRDEAINTLAKLLKECYGYIWEGETLLIPGMLARGCTQDKAFEKAFKELCPGTIFSGTTFAYRTTDTLITSLMISDD